jgi:nucleoside-diphosphate-sugar epimerase
VKILITGAAGNLGTFICRHLLAGPYQLKLMIHQRQPSTEILRAPNVKFFRADLGETKTLYNACQDTDCIIHLAGILFAPQPEKFLPTTNLTYVQNLVTAALATNVKKFILISFPHVEGESTPHKPALGQLAGRPDSVHAQTRLAAEKHIFAASQDSSMVAVSLRPGMIYARGVLMIDAARWLLKHRLMGVWRKPTWIHLLSLPDFLRSVQMAIDKNETAGIYNLGDDRPLTLQDFLDRAARQWGYPPPWRAPQWSFFLAAWCVETYARLFQTSSPLTRDFIRIGMASYVMDTSRMKSELLPNLTYPSLDEGISLL